LCVGDESDDGVCFGFCYVCWEFCYGVFFVEGELFCFAPELFGEFLDLVFFFGCCCFFGCDVLGGGFGCVCWAGGL